MPDSFGWSRRICSTCESGELLGTTFRIRFSRLKLETNSCESGMSSWRLMSARTWCVAVAVSAIVTASANFSRTSTSLRYSGLKSWPQSEIQCASSIVRQSTRMPFNSACVRGRNSVSGARYSILTLPERTAEAFSSYSIRSSELLRHTARTPSSLSCETWSCISEINGETTIVRPSNISAGIW